MNVINELYLFSNISFKRIERVVKHGLLPGRSTFWDILRNWWHEVLNTNDCDIFIQYYLFSLRLQAYWEVGALELFDLSNSVCHWLTLLLSLHEMVRAIKSHVIVRDWPFWAQLRVCRFRFSSTTWDSPKDCDLWVPFRGLCIVLRPPWTSLKASISMGR